MKNTSIIKILLASILLSIYCLFYTSCNSCTSSKHTPQEKQSSSTRELERTFPEIDVPSIIEDKDKLNYIAEHFWNQYLDTAKIYLCDSTHVNGVPKSELKKVFGQYSALLNMNLFPENYFDDKRDGRGEKGEFALQAYIAEYQHSIKLIEVLFENLVNFQTHYPESKIISEFTSLASTYLYGPNSPTRNEELYHAYVQNLVKCNLISEEEKMIYEYEERLTGLNRIGTKVANLDLKDIKGKVFSIHDFKSEYTILIFINPGCNSCKYIIDQLKSAPEIVQMIKKRELTIVTAYIDSQLELWKEHLDDYSTDWYNGYDFKTKVREDLVYNVRSIPSIYLLDSHKNIILKDMPETLLFNFLNCWNIAHL